MQAGRDQVRDSTRHVTANGSGWFGLCVEQVHQFNIAKDFGLFRVTLGKPADRPTSVCHSLASAAANLQRAGISLTGHYLKLSRRVMIATLAVISVVLLNNHGSNAQMASQDKPPIAYFLDRVPESLDSSTLPKTARDVVVARVRVAGPPAYLIGRDQSGRPPPLPPYLYHARLKILDVRSGNAAIGEMVDVTFGVPKSPAWLSIILIPRNSWIAIITLSCIQATTGNVI